MSGDGHRLAYVIASLAIAIIPLAAWYARAIHLYGAWVFGGTSAWMDQEVTGALSPAWRRYTGIFEYAWMLAKSYWPWLPFTIAGAAAVIRRRDRRLLLLIVWAAVVAVMCASVRSRVLRYMLPAYPAFSILAAIGLVRVVPLGYVRNGIRVLTPLLAVAVIGIAVFPPEAHHAAEIRSPVAVAAASVTPPNGRIVFYDSRAAEVTTRRIRSCSTAGGTS